jgi:hypothetical protein
MKLRGYIPGDAQAKRLLEHIGITPEHPDYDRCRRIAGAYFSFDELGDARMRNMMFAQLLREVAARTKDNARRDAGELRQKLNRQRSKLDLEQRPWIPYFTARAVATGSALQAARDVKRRYPKITESVDAIRMQARRAALVTPRKHRKPLKK